MSKKFFKIKDYLPIRRTSLRFAIAFSAFTSLKSYGKQSKLRLGQRKSNLQAMAHKKVVEVLGENLASTLELLKKWFVEWSVDVPKLLHYGQNMKKEDLLGLVAGTHKVVPIQVDKKDDPIVLRFAINLNDKPTQPFSGATVEKHSGGGRAMLEKRADGLYIDGKKILLHRSERQMNGKFVVGHELRKELDGKPVLNACIQDFLMANQEFIPEDWKKDDAGNTIYIFFWGTIFRDADGSLCVRCLYFKDDGWRQDYDWLIDDWYGVSLAAILAS